MVHSFLYQQKSFFKALMHQQEKDFMQFVQTSVNSATLKVDYLLKDVQNFKN